MPSLSVIALIRHGDYRQPVGVPSALLPYQLTDLGFQQARDAAASCVIYAEQNGLTIDPILDSSMQLRAWQTATLMAESFSEEQADVAAAFGVQEFSDLSERSVGAVANLSVAAIELLLAEDPRYPSPPPGWKSNSHYCLPFQGAESLTEAGKRVAHHLQWRADQFDLLPNQLPNQLSKQLSKQLYNQQRLKIVVGHGAAIRHACVHLGLLDLESVSTISMHHARPVFVAKDDTGWHMVGGAWKSRSANNDGDEIREG